MSASYTKPWCYAAATGGIVSSVTPVTLKAAYDSVSKVGLDSIQVSHATLSATTEVAVRDIVTATVLWRGTLQTTATDISGGAGSISFTTPIFSSAGSGLEFVVLTSVTGGVYVNAQGHID